MKNKHGKTFFFFRFSLHSLEISFFFTVIGIFDNLKK